MLQQFNELQQTLQHDYNEEDQQIIAAPTIDQVKDTEGGNDGYIIFFSLTYWGMNKMATILEMKSLNVSL